LKLVRVFFRLLKSLGVFDNSLIIVMGDHGHPRGKLGRFLPHGLGTFEAPPANIPTGVIEGATPLLLVKRFSAGGEMNISDAPVSIADIAKTVFAELRIASDCPGESIFNVAESARRPRHFYFYTWSRDDWKSEYLPPLVEYQVDGHSWLNGSWRSTGRILNRP
jgi:arylsulfatase A-like enzyme